MSQSMVRYKVKPEYAALNEELARRVYEELHETAPEGIRYATFALPDDVSFVHVASIDVVDDRNPLMEVAAFRAFLEDIGERCDEPPVRVELRKVGSYCLFGSESSIREVTTVG